MFPDLSYLSHYLFGTPPDNWLSIFKTFGFFLAMGFLAAALVFNIELRRKAREGVFQPRRVKVTEGAAPSLMDILGNAVIGLLIGGKGVYAYLNFEEFKIDPASVILSGKMNAIGALFGAALLGGWTWWDSYRKRRSQPVVREVLQYPHDKLSEMTVAAAVGGIVGAKLFDVLDNWRSFLDDPAGALLSGGGLAIYGGLVLGYVFVSAYMRRHDIPFLPAADACAPALVAGYGVGRIGCELSGDGDWGIVNAAPNPGWLPDWLWATRYPHHVLNTPHTDPVASVPIEGCDWNYCMQLSAPVYPTPLYETLLMVGVFGILWALRRRLKTPGLLFAIYIMLISAERFMIEQIRVNVMHDFLGMKVTQAEIISVVLFLGSLAGAVYLVRKNKPAVPQPG
jgi:phosphatidylglycerol:prolipoprotein diacylglycerol transferase